MRKRGGIPIAIPEAKIVIKIVLAISFPIGSSKNAYLISIILGNSIWFKLISSRILNSSSCNQNKLTNALIKNKKVGVERSFISLLDLHKNLVEENDLDIALNDLEEKMDEKSFENFMRIKKESISKN